MGKKTRVRILFIYIIFAFFLLLLLLLLPSHGWTFIWFDSMSLGSGCCYASSHTQWRPIYFFCAYLSQGFQTPVQYIVKATNENFCAATSTSPSMCFRYNAVASTHTVSAITFNLGFSVLASINNDEMDGYLNENESDYRQLIIFDLARKWENNWNLFMSAVMTLNRFISHESWAHKRPIMRSHRMFSPSARICASVTVSLSSALRTLRYIAHLLLTCLVVCPGLGAHWPNAHANRLRKIFLQTKTKQMIASTVVHYRSTLW